MERRRGFIILSLLLICLFELYQCANFTEPGALINPITFQNGNVGFSSVSTSQTLWFSYPAADALYKEFGINGLTGRLSSLFIHDRGLFAQTVHMVNSNDFVFYLFRDLNKPMSDSTSVFLSSPILIPNMTLSYSCGSFWDSAHQRLVTCQSSVDETVVPAMFTLSIYTVRASDLISDRPKPVVAQKVSQLPLTTGFRSYVYAVGFTQNFTYMGVAFCNGSAFVFTQQSIVTGETLFSFGDVSHNFTADSRAAAIGVGPEADTWLAVVSDNSGENLVYTNPKAYIFPASPKSQYNLTLVMDLRAIDHPCMNGAEIITRIDKLFILCSSRIYTYQWNPKVKSFEYTASAVGQDWVQTGYNSDFAPTDYISIADAPYLSSLDSIPDPLNTTYNVLHFSAACMYSANISSQPPIIIQYPIEADTISSCLYSHPPQNSQTNWGNFVYANRAAPGFTGRYLTASDLRYNGNFSKVIYNKTLNANYTTYGMFFKPYSPSTLYMVSCISNVSKVDPVPNVIFTTVDIFTSVNPDASSTQNNVIQLDLISDEVELTSFYSASACNNIQQYVLLAVTPTFAFVVMSDSFSSIRPFSAFTFYFDTQYVNVSSRQFALSTNAKMIIDIMGLFTYQSDVYALAIISPPSHFTHICRLDLHKYTATVVSNLTLPLVYNGQMSETEDSFAFKAQEENNMLEVEKGTWRLRAKAVVDPPEGRDCFIITSEPFPIRRVYESSKGSDHRFWIIFSVLVVFGGAFLLAAVVAAMIMYGRRGRGPFARFFNTADYSSIN